MLASDPPPDHPDAALSAPPAAPLRMVDLEPVTRPPRVIPISAEAEELLQQAARLLTDPSAFWHGGEDVAISAQHELFVIAARLYNDLYLVLPAPPQGQEAPPAGGDPALAWAAPIPFCTEAVAPPLGELLRDLAVQHTARVLTALHPHLIPAEMDRLAQHRGDDAQLLPARFSGAARWLRAHLDWLTDYLTPGELEFQADAKAAAQAQAAAEATWAALKARQIYVGAPAPPERWTHLGWRQPDGTPVALCREGGQVFFMAGAIGSGKSQALLSLIDGALTPQPGITSPTLPRTVAVAFHTDLTGVSLPELCSAVYPNQRQPEVDFLWEHLRLPPRGLSRVRMLVPTTQLDEVQARAQKALGSAASDGRLEILPLRLRLGDLGARGLEALLGIGPGENPRYLRTVLRVAAELGPNLTVADLEARLQGVPGMNATTRGLALERLSILEHLEDPESSLWDLVEPGTLTIINLSGAWLARQHALPTLVALLNGLAQPSPRHGPLQRLLCLDEINRLEGEVTEWMHLVMLLRQIRHTGSSVVLSGQDFLNTPDEAFGQGTQFLCFRVMNPKVLHHLQQRVAGFAGLRAQTVAGLHPGHALWAPTECSDPGWRGEAQQVYIRPARCQHGGHTVAVL